MGVINNPVLQLFCVLKVEMIHEEIIDQEKISIQVLGTGFALDIGQLIDIVNY
jgi:hypothetical protein